MHGPKANLPMWTRFQGVDMIPILRKELLHVDEEMTEVSLLLPGWQAQSLEAVARCEGVSTGQILRRLIQEYCGARLNRFAVD
jgi:hypothetical protein